MTQLIITNYPAKEAGEHISESIREHVGDVVCILSGDTIIEVAEHIDPSKHCFHQDCKEVSGPRDGEPTKCQRSECRTIFITGDEWVSGETKTNNYSHLHSTYSNHLVTKNLIETIPKDNETAKEFAERIEKYFLETLLGLSNPKIILLADVGIDGQVAGIVSMDELSFRRVYQDDRTYVSVPTEGIRIDSRASFAPSWILGNVDEMIGCVVGADKLEILTKLNLETKKLSERPAELFNLHRRVSIYTDQNLEE